MKTNISLQNEVDNLSRICREREADAAVMRQALEHAHTAINYAVTSGFEDTIKTIINSAISTNAGRDLLAKVERLRGDMEKEWIKNGDLREKIERQEDELSALRRKVEAAKEMAESLESCKANVEHEIRRRKLLKQSTDQWPDVLTGCVSGGGIEAALAKWQEVNK